MNKLEPIVRDSPRLFAPTERSIDLNAVFHAELRKKRAK